VKEPSESKHLQEKIRELFERDDMDVLLGWKQNREAGVVTPAIFRKGDALDDLVFDRRCVHNLTNYLPSLVSRYPRVGVVVKGCDGRSLTTQIVEHRINRSKIVAVAVACEGVDVDGRQAEKCSDCATHVSSVADVVIGEPGEAGPPQFQSLAEIEKMSPEERWAFFSSHFARCTRCYACRQICPTCYCEICVADQHEPKWIEASAKPSANAMWHLTRAFHTAGRCADCGECERVCPQDIPLRVLNNAMEKAVIAMFGTRPGTEPGELPPLVVLSEGDSDAILGGTYE
jgi:formate dehydrogenase subunit beta